MTNESPIVSFRVPLDAIARLQELGRLPQDYKKADLSNLIRNEWLATLGGEVPVVVDGMSVAKQEDVNAVHSRLDEMFQLLRSLPSDLGKSVAV